MLKKLLIVSSMSILTACGGGSTSTEETLAGEREANECVNLVANDSMIQNVCDFPIVVRFFVGSQTPVTIAAGDTVANPDFAALSGFVRFGACRSPFTPVLEGGFLECL